MEHTQLQQIARTVRQDIIRQVYCAGSGHPGGSLSAADLLTALYFSEMRIDPAMPDMAGRDRFVLSKGHAAPALYSALAERGYFDRAELVNLRKLEHMLQGHPSLQVPGVEIATGSLGQGFSGAVGFALANRLNKDPGQVYVVL
ncbi:MAG: transketolase, partial [Firmicutes bacterium]|nr:transketolase [Bacillota bacterium]